MSSKSDSMLENLPPGMQPAYTRARPLSTQWHPTVPGLQTSWDATSLKEFMFCPRRYYYVVILGFKAKSESHHLRFGQMYHAALEVYDQALALGADHDQAQRLAVNQVLLDSWGWESNDKVKNRFSLWRTVQWYTEVFTPDKDPLVTVKLNGRPAVELSFNFGLDRLYEGTEFTLSGHMDRLVTLGKEGSVFADERKTTGKFLDAKYYNSFKPDVQIDIYTIAGKIVLHTPAEGVYIDAAQVLVNSSRFGRAESRRTPDDIEEFFSDFDSILDSAIKYAKDEYWPKHSRMCFMCPFHNVCNKSPSMRPYSLLSEFQQEDWDPTISRIQF